MKTLTAKLLEDTGSQQFYQLNLRLTKGIQWGKIKEVSIELEEHKKRIKPEYREGLQTDGYEMICVSDAHTHFERLVFTARRLPDGKLTRTQVVVDGSMTMSIHGGDASSMKSVEVYLRRISKVNGYAFRG